MAGGPADVYSLAKTLCIFLTNKEFGFEGQYDPNSINGLQKFNFKLKNQGYIPNPEKPIYTKLLDDLLIDSTNNDPDQRPKIEEFVNKLKDWLDTYQEFSKHNPLQWSESQQKLFPLFIPTRVIWEKEVDIINVLNYIGSIESLNHMLFPYHGGLDLKGAKHGREEGNIELVADGYIYIVKPKRLIFESFSFEWEWNYFRLETGDLEPLNLNGSSHEEYDESLIELEPLNYISINYLDEGVYNGEEFPDTARVVNRVFHGSFVIFQKTSTYNRIQSTYDGRHNQMDADEFRAYISGKIDLIKGLRTESFVANHSKESNTTIDEIIFWILNKIFQKELKELFQKD